MTFKSGWCLGILGLLALEAAASVAPGGATPAMVFGRKVSKVELSEVLTYPARVVPKFNSTILAETDGVVSRIHAPLGQPVRAKQKVITISHTDPVYQYAPVNLLSPIGGIVSAVEVSEGSQVTRGQKLASVTDPHRLRVVVEVPAGDLPALKPGQGAEFSIPGTETALPVRILGLSPFVDPATGTASCEFELILKKGETPKLAPGVVGRVAVKTNLRQGITIPEFAVLYKDQGTFIRRLEENKVKQVAVKLGKKQQGQVEILSGLNDQDFLVERSSRFVSDGEEVTVQKADDEKNQ